MGRPGGDVSDTHDIFARLLARLDKIEAFIKTQRLGEEVHTLALCQVFQAAAEDGAAAFAAAVELHGAPAVVRASAAAGGVDITAYGFSTEVSAASGDDDIDVQEELRDLRQQIGGAFSGAGGAVSSLVAHYSPPTEEFPGGVELVPVRHHVPTVSIDPPVSAVACSFPRQAASFVEPEEKSRAPINDLFADMDGEDSPPPIDEWPRAVTSCGVSAVLQLFTAADGGMAAAAPGGDLASEHYGVPTWDVP
ncbi:hypothetical protein CYMTET_26802 [Cymbomonas tetramitiformis]|uniref:Uncharacterized protein n=1 Tax=Cymbomonas tetramitiformis TaxID=36881 RepID=A0AAE0FR12_9CHLO|nr:hypothetical protein CYMTET_26802 [Cymbomonas tetramitiformis]